MKVEVTEQEKKFEPIELKITIESEQELCDLWHRINMAKNSIERSDYSSIKNLKHGISPGNQLLYDVINNLVNINNLVQ